MLYIYLVINRGCVEETDIEKIRQFFLHVTLCYIVCLVIRCGFVFASDLFKGDLLCSFLLFIILYLRSFTIDFHTSMLQNPYFS